MGRCECCAGWIAGLKPCRGCSSQCCLNCRGGGVQKCCNCKGIACRGKKKQKSTSTSNSSYSSSRSYSDSDDSDDSADEEEKVVRIPLLTVDEQIEEWDKSVFFGTLEFMDWDVVRAVKAGEYDNDRELAKYIATSVADAIISFLEEATIPVPVLHDKMCKQLTRAEIRLQKVQMCDYWFSKFEVDENKLKITLSGPTSDFDVFENSRPLIVDPTFPKDAIQQLIKCMKFEYNDATYQALKDRANEAFQRSKKHIE